MGQIEILCMERRLKKDYKKSALGTLKYPVPFRAPNKTNPFQPTSLFLICFYSCFQVLVVKRADNLLDEFGLGVHMNNWSAVDRELDVLLIGSIRV